MYHDDAHACCSSPADLARRLARLEREARRLRRLLAAGGIVAGVALVGLVVALGTTARAAKPRVVKAGRFVVEGADGRVRATLGGGGGPGLTLYNASGKVVAGLTASEGKRSVLFLNDGQGVQRAVLSVLQDEISLGINDRKGRSRASVKVTKSGPAIALQDPRGQVRAGLLLREGGPNLVLRDAQGKVRAGLKVDAKKGPVLGLLNARGKLVFYKP